MLDAVTVWKYLGVFLALLAAGLGFPIPEEIPIVTAGALVGHAAQSNVHPVWWLMLPMCILGVVISDGFLYGIGRWWGPSLLERRWVQKRLLPPEKQARIRHNFEEYGVRILLVARLLPGIRTPIFMMAGIIRLPLGKFLLADGLYAIPGVNLLFWLAYWFTDQFVELVEQAEKARPLVVIIVLTAVAGFFLVKFLRREVTTGDPEELPKVAQKVASRLVEGGKHPDHSHHSDDHVSVDGESKHASERSEPSDAAQKRG